MKNTLETLINCEESGLAPRYIIDDVSYMKAKTSLFEQFRPVRTDPIKLNTNGEEIFVVSDLHIASGRNESGVYSGTENFFAADSFKRFLEYADKIKKTEKAHLIINGDIFDFLRITEYPGKIRRIRLPKRIKHQLKLDPISAPSEPDKNIVKRQFKEWSFELEKVGINKSAVELENSISKKEKKYGLRTDDYKTIYKLILIRKGHPAFIESLAQWLENGNKILVVKGNHDLEICLLAVRNYLRLILAENITHRNSGADIEKVLKDVILPNITFVDDSVEIDEEFYVEHGHRYDKFCMVLNNPFLDEQKGQINIPFGSFFNRYLLNKVELFYPFLDNIRPAGNVLPVLMKENFALGLKVLFQHIPLLVRILFTNFRYVRFMLNRVAWFALVIVLPLAVLVYFSSGTLSSVISQLDQAGSGKGIAAILIDQIKNMFLLFFSYLLSRLVAWFQLSEPSSLNEFAKERFGKTDYKIMTMGHTHNPGGYIFDGDKKFYNTGTWVPVIETSTSEIREDKTYSFLHLVRDENGRLTPANSGILQRWNDNAGRAESLILIKRK